MKTKYKFKAWKLIDKYLIIPPTLLLSTFKFSKNSKEKIPKKILAIGFLGFGDLILTLPSLKAIKSEFKNTEIDVLTFSNYVNILEKQEYIHKVYSNNLNFLIKNLNSYDLVIDFGQYTNYSAFVATLLGKKSIGYSHKPSSHAYAYKIKFKDGQHMSKSFYDLLQPLNLKNYNNSLIKLKSKSSDYVSSILNLSNQKKNILVGFHMGSSVAQGKRCWPLKRFTELINLFLEKNKNSYAIILGSKEDISSVQSLIKSLPENLRKRVINTAGKTSLSETCNLISHLDAFVGNDSGPMHISAAQGIPTVGIFAANLPVRYRPLNKNSFYIRKCTCPEKPCINVQFGSGEPKKSCHCDKCLLSIKSEEVYQLLSKVLSKNKS